MHILLLHGALGAAAQMEPLARQLSAFASPHTLNFTGHGGTTVPEEPFLIRDFANQVLAWMDEQKLKTMNFVGYSMGGYVALYIARHHPERVGKILTLATKFLWTPEIAEREKKNLDPDYLTRNLPDFASGLEKRHGAGNWKTLLKKSGEMIIKIAADNPLKNDDYRVISLPVLVCVGDSDKMVSLEETMDVYRQLGNASLLVLPGTAHPLENLDPEMVAYHARRFFED